MEGSAERIANYRASIEGKNKAMKNAVDSFWEFSAEVIYKPFSEAKKIVKKEKDKYAFLHYGEEILNGSVVYGYKGSSTDSYCYFYKGGKLEYDYNSRHSFKSYNVYTLHIELPSSNAITVFLSKSCPTLTDVQLGLIQIQYTFDYILTNPTSSIRAMMMKQLSINSSELKDKTLLIDGSDMMNRYTKEEITKSYPYAFKIGNYFDIEKAVSQRDTNSVVINFARFNDTERIFYILNAGNGKIYASFTNDAYHYGGGESVFRAMYYPGILLTDIDKIVD